MKDGQVVGILGIHGKNDTVAILIIIMRNKKSTEGRVSVNMKVSDDLSSYGKLSEGITSKRIRTAPPEKES